MTRSSVTDVDPFIGIDSPGHCLCGPYLPHGLVRLGPDTVQPCRSSAGYDTGQPIIRFSHTHVSGTGGGSRYGNIGITPFCGKSASVGLAYRAHNEHAEAGYYRVELEPDAILAELTVTARTGLHRYTFPEREPLEAGLIIDVGAVIQVENHELGKDTGICTGGFAERASPNEIVGRGDFKGGWGHARPYSVFFSAHFDSPFESVQFANNAGVAADLDGARDAVDGGGCRAIVRLGARRQVTVRVGISFSSVAQARVNVAREASGLSFDAGRAAAAAVWEQKLARIRTEGGTSAQRRFFATMCMRLRCLPTDLGVDEENSWWSSGVRQFADFYCLWDSVRNANSFLNLIDAELQADFLNALLDIADHTGWLPDAWIAGHHAAAQGGSSADVLFSEAQLKGIGGVDYSRALRYMRQNAEAPSPTPETHGRYLEDYAKLGYVTTRVERGSVSKHLEYAYQDYCIGRLATALGDTALGASLIERSSAVWNLWREELRSFAPRRPDGSWVSDFDPDRSIARIWLDPYFYEGTGRQWSFSAHHDFAGLVARHGGLASFVRHLDEFFERGHFAPKETMLHVPYLYHYAGRPDLSSARVHEIMQERYQPHRSGLPDNEDMGCHSTWYMCACLGFYPVMGQDLYLLTTPVFDVSEIELGASGKRLRIETRCRERGRFIRTATLNGERLDRAWVRHRELAGGATLIFELGPAPSAWGAEPPPSPLASIRGHAPRCETLAGSDQSDV